MTPDREEDKPLRAATNEAVLTADELTREVAYAGAAISIEIDPP